MPGPGGHEGYGPQEPEQVNHPPHYNAHPSGVECIDVVEHMSFNLGNAVKYVWRAGLKSPDAETDLEKALWYIKRELRLLRKRKAASPIRNSRGA